MTKEELKKFIENKREIEIIKDKLEYLEEKKTSIKSMIIEDMPKDGNCDNDRIGDLLGEIEELINIYIEKELKLIKQQIQIEKVIEKLDDPIDRNIIRLKYLNGHTWEKICVILNYSWNGVHKKHKKILLKIK